MKRFGSLFIGLYRNRLWDSGWISDVGKVWGQNSVHSTRLRMLLRLGSILDVAEDERAKERGQQTSQWSDFYLSILLVVPLHICN